MFIDSEIGFRVRGSVYKVGLRRHVHVFLVASCSCSITEVGAWSDMSLYWHLSNWSDFSETQKYNQFGSTYCLLWNNKLSLSPVGWPRAKNLPKSENSASL